MNYQRKRTAATRRRTNTAPSRAPQRSFFMGIFVVFVFALLYTFGFLTPNSAQAMPEEGEIFIYYIDVGQGDSTLIQSRDHAVLIDAGEAQVGRRVVQQLRKAGVTRLDYVVATHPHADHIGGLAAVLAEFEVGHIIMPDATNNSQTFENFLIAIENHNIPVIIPSVGDRIEAGIINMTVLAPGPPPYSNLNNASVVLRMDHGQLSFLFMGDAETESEQAMLASGRSLRAHVLRTGHHGSSTSTTQAFLNAVAPRAAIISSGAGNTYGHPHREVLDRLEAAGARVFRTDEMGTILMVSNGKDIWRIW